VPAHACAKTTLPSAILHLAKQSTLKDATKYKASSLNRKTTAPSQKLLCAHENWISAMTSQEIHRPDGSRVSPLPGGPTPPLTHSNRNKVPYGKTIFKMQFTGFHQWGFVIVRTAPYNDANDELWNTMLKRIYAEAESDLAQKDVATSSLLQPLVQWEVLEDLEHPLEDMDVEGAKRRFLAWRDAALVETGRTVARFRYFIMIDQESLDSLKEEREVADSPNPPNNLPPVKVRVVNAGRPDEVQENDEENEEDDEDEEYHEDEDYEWDLRWMWVTIDLLLEFYDILGADQGWDLFYKRPPNMYGW
jgi:hypothetical protein